MNTIKNIILSFSLFIGLQGVFAQTENPVISAIQKEVERNKTELKLESMAPPFFISYSVVETYSYSLSASLGTISSFNESHNRRGLPRVLVGDYHRNTANVAGARMFNPALTSLTDNIPGIPITIWRGLDDIYKDAAERYKAKMATLQQQTQTEEEINLPDFEQIKPVNMVLQPVPVKFDRPYWENYLRKASETAKLYPDILTSNVSLSVQNTMAYTYNTEGSCYAVPASGYVLRFSANVRADDGQDLNRTISEESVVFEQMPDLTTFINRCKTMMEELLKLKDAPVIDDAYSGPVLFENLAAERIFRMAFFDSNKLSAAPKMVGPSNPMGGSGPQGGNDFEMMLNKKVISRDFTVKSITGQEFYKGRRLDGYYPIDDEGVVPDKELVLIDNGVLRNMLNGRKPTKKIQHSNGHSRLNFNSNAWQVVPGNILITSNQTFSNEELRKKLLAAAKEEDLEYAYIVRYYEGQTNFIYKVFVADGREELVRGATISDAANLKNFKRILGASDKEQIRSMNNAQATIICPDALLFEEMDVVRIPNIEFKKPYIVAKPN
jgi:predicted Zn-dependent protease